jgi:RNA polymerase sigma-70 factor (ECF subfamily)
MSNAPANTEPTVSGDDLVVLARRDKAAFAALYDRYYPRIIKYCLRRLYLREVAQDVTSEIFLSVAAHLPKFDGSTETDFRRWLFRIASNAVNAHLRQTGRRQEIFQAAARSGRLSGSQNTLAIAAPAELLDWPAVYQAILELEPREQTILSLRFFADLSHDEIGAVIEASAGAVRTALSRILNGLRKRFDVERALPKGQP